VLRDAGLTRGDGMTGAWPWLAVAGVGALHGLNPATGWLPAAARGVRAGDRRQALKALVPVAVGHAASVVLVAVLAMLGLAAGRGVLQWLASALAIVALAVCWSGHGAGRMRGPAGDAGLALGAFAMATAHGAGLMLVPALIPLCVSASPAREITASGSLMLAVAAVMVHMAAMLAVTGLAALAACRGWNQGACRLRTRWSAVGRHRAVTLNPVTNAVPTITTSAPASVFQPSGSSRNRCPHSTPNTGTRNVTVSADAAPMSATSRKYSR
jgi:hypothetical protein